MSFLSIRTLSTLRKQRASSLSHSFCEGVLLHFLRNCYYYDLDRQLGHIHIPVFSTSCSIRALSRTKARPLESKMLRREMVSSSTSVLGHASHSAIVTVISL